MVDKYIYIKIIPRQINFGDGLVENNFFNKLCDINAKLIPTKQEYNFDNYITIGSIMRQCDENSIICGTGFISQNSDLGSLKYSFDNKMYRKPKKICFVRGPLTREKLLHFGIDCPKIYGDPAILCPLLYKPSSTNEYDVGILPHYVDNKKIHDFIKTLEAKGLKVIVLNIMSARDPESLVSLATKCSYLISSSLHGLILGISYNIKTIWVKFSSQVMGNTFKFDDFFHSLQIFDYKYSLPTDINVLENIIPITNDNLLKIGFDIIQNIPFFKNDIIKSRRQDEWSKYIATLE